MSSTKKNSETRQKFDYYRTPVDQIVLFLGEFEKEIPLAIDQICILDPCAGGDYNNPMSYPEALQQHFGAKLTTNLVTVDIREDSRADIIEDYLQHEVDYEPDLIITNPPFSLAQPILTKALSDVKDGGWVVMLLRLNFFGSVGRKVFFDKYMPVYTFVHRKRMSFTPDGQTDSIEYMHAVFQKRNNPDFTRLKII